MMSLQKFFVRSQARTKNFPNSKRNSSLLYKIFKNKFNKIMYVDLNTYYWMFEFKLANFDIHICHGMVATNVC